MIMSGESIYYLSVFVVVLLAVAFTLGLRRGKNIGHAQEQAARKAALANDHPLFQDAPDWITKPCEMLIPNEDLQALWNTHGYSRNGKDEVKNVFRLSLRRADRITLEFKDCQHKSVGLAALNAPERETETVQD